MIGVTTITTACDPNHRPYGDSNVSKIIAQIPRMRLGPAQKDQIVQGH
jgi:hypothetical protein